MRSVLLSLVLLLPLFSSCSRKVYPVYERPDPTGPLYDFDTFQSMSVIEVPVMIPMAFLEMALDSIIPDRYEEHDREVECIDAHIPGINFRECKVDGGMDIGKLSFQPSDSGFIATVALEGVMTYKWKWKSLVTLGSWREESKDLHFKGKLDVLLNPRVGPDLTLIPNFDIKFHFDEAYFYFGTKINVRSYLARYLNRSVKTFINEYIEDNHDQFQLSNHLAPVWDQLSGPILLLEDHHVWLLIEPQNLYYQNLLLADTALVFGLGLETRLTTIWGNRPGPVQIDPISEISTNEFLTGDFGVKLPMLITYDKLTQLVNENFGRKEFIINSDLRITASNIQVLGLENRMVIKLNFKAKFKNKKTSGWLFFNCLPSYDKQNHTLYLTKTDFDLRTKNVLLKVSKWLYNDKINQELEKHLIFQLGKYIENSKDNLIKMINNDYWDDKIHLEGNMDHFEVGDLVIRPEGLLLIISMSGALKATLKDFIRY